MSGLLALLDDVAAISKVAAASLDDVAGQAAKAGSKAMGAVIDDAAVTPKYMKGFDAARELPIVWKIARGSIFNKLVILLPIALILATFAPWMIPPLLMLGGAYLCFEGAEKVAHLFVSKDNHESEKHIHPEGDGAALEEKRVAGAIKTDFILSAEIMTIALSALPDDLPLWEEALVLAVVAIGITILVYGSVAIIVKADDVGVHLAAKESGFLSSLGEGIVRVMPGFMNALLVIGTAAMIWVGGQIILHGAHQMGMHEPYETIKHLAENAAAAVPSAPGLVNWLVTAFCDGVIGLIIGLILIPIVEKILVPLYGATIGRMRGNA
ncbi:DUF808 domain-containing protein [Paracoccaceae bacterium GXU_MW_L88]